MNSTERLSHLAKTLKRRNRAEKRLKFYGITAILFALGFLVTLLGTVVTNGYTALQQTEIAIDLELPVAELVDESGAIDMKKSAAFNWDGMVKKAFRKQFPDVSGMMNRRALGDLISANAGYELRLDIEKSGRIDQPSGIFWVKSSDDVDMLMKGRMDRTIPENQRRLNDMQIGWVDALVANERIDLVFNRSFFTKADSREPESAGILGAIVGSAFALIVTMLFALPLAVMAAIYLEYFARPGGMTDFIEVNINNLAAVPSIVFGLLGLAVFLGFFGMPRSARWSVAWCWR